MCNLSLGVEDRGVEKGIERGLAQGMEKGVLNSLRSLIKNTDASADKALAMLENPQSEWQRYKFLLAEK